MEINKTVLLVTFIGNTRMTNKPRQKKVEPSKIIRIPETLYNELAELRVGFEAPHAVISRLIKAERARQQKGNV